VLLNPDIHPLCPEHCGEMQPQGPVGPDVVFACAKNDCTFRWQWREGYFYEDGGQASYPSNIHEVLKPALIREHGYMYIASIEEHQRTWRCAVKDCPNTIIDGV
jgi:hypothetical protein